jgi:hypothetical protein
MRWLLLSIIFILPHGVVAQNTDMMNQGTAFGNTLAPIQPSQIVNPSGVNPQAWGSSMQTPRSLPSGLGGFSTPHTQGTELEQAKLIGLSGLGNAAMDRCENYVSTGDPIKDHECAAVNFLSQRCMTPSTRQARITNKAGAGSSQSKLMSSYCDGSYGQGENQFHFKEQITENDDVFSAIAGAQKNAGEMTGQSCTQKNVVTEPALYEINQCIKSSNTEEVSCSQFLRVTEVKEPGCTPGQFLTRVIADPCPRCIDKIIYDFSCTATGYNMHVFTMYKKNNQVHQELGSRDIAGKVGFSVQRTLGPNSHTHPQCYSTYYTQSCTNATCSITTEFHNECQKTSYKGTNNFVIPMISKYDSHWENQCVALEQSAGISLGTP